jgi:hypothetical protein
MTTASTAHALIKARIEANKPASVVSLRWQNEDGDALPAEPAPFLYTELNTERQFIAGYGGGLFLNLWRTSARIECFAFVPRGWGMSPATDLAETIAALFRSYQPDEFKCFGATVSPLGTGSGINPPGVDSEADNYYCAVAEIALHYDQIG